LLAAFPLNKRIYSFAQPGGCVNAEQTLRLAEHMQRVKSCYEATIHTADERMMHHHMVMLVDFQQS
jgi:hypothetical protein